MSKEYGLYDTKYYDECVCLGSMNEIAKYLNYSRASLYSHITRKRQGIRDLLERRYELVEIPETEIEEEIIKTDEEVFEELINVFIPEKHNFKEFDPFKDEIKQRMNMIIIDEEWKEIPNFNYSISNYGRVRNDKTGKIKELRVGKYGYQINLWNKGNAKMFTLSRLVAHFFIREVQQNERVRHIDGDIRNNFYKNLEIVNIHAH